MTIKEVFEQAEQEVRKKGLYDAISARIDAINDAVIGSNAEGKVRTLSSQILHLTAANERVTNEPDKHECR